MGELAQRQADWRHRIVLKRAAAAIGRASGREVVPGRHGELAEELAHDLAADVITGSTCAPGLPELTVRERAALVAVCALAAVMPAAVLGDVKYKIPPLASAMDAAHAAGRAAGPGTGAAWPAEGPGPCGRG
ncbi:hypothetical protein GCM10009759_27740 [Kitasatospora saccharophila]|uniref:MftR C-terminal domain-containing protein n=1 Tax=Kitasatospora saccharophila TaxID=407973 RepID=A0ABN2WRD5_9ACTN